jgi:hypothetical protein
MDDEGMKLDMTKRQEEKNNNGRKKEITGVGKREEGINKGRKKR